MIPNLTKTIDKHYPEFRGVHPACLAVPMCSDEEFDRLVESIKENGLREPILRTKDGLLLDGRTRLLACYVANQDIRLVDDKGIVDPWVTVKEKNIDRRHLTVGQKAAFGDELRAHYEALAKERQKLSNGRGKKGTQNSAEVKGESRDQAAAAVGVSHASLDQFRTIKENLPEAAKEVASGNRTLNDAHKEAKAKQREQERRPTGKESKLADKLVQIITADGVTSEIAGPKTVRFNRTNDSVDWASWTWNPVTGCNHGCSFCYAREIAHRDRMAPYYPNKFEPTFHEYRLNAPKNTPVSESDSERDGRVFVCSMADLFGKWVPDKWIRSVFKACIESPEWEYLFLTKWPARYAKMPLIDSAWYGASIVTQSDVKRIETAMQNFKGDMVKWVSMEPMLEPIKFNTLSWCDLVVIGAQTSTTQPEGFVPAFSPQFDWIVDVVNQCRKAGVPYYLKANLGLESPGMSLPKSPPRRR